MPWEGPRNPSDKILEEAKIISETDDRKSLPEKKTGLIFF